MNVSEETNRRAANVDHHLPSPPSPEAGPMTLTMDPPVDLGVASRPVTVTRVALQQRQRLYREGLAQLLAVEDDVEVVALATTDTELLVACQHDRPGVVVIEADVTDWDPVRLVAALRRVMPRLVVVGLTASPPTMQAEMKARRAGMSALVPRLAGITGILGAVRAAANPLLAVRWRRRAGRRPRPSRPPRC